VLDEPTEGIQPSIIKDIGRAISYLREGRHGDPAGRAVFRLRPRTRRRVVAAASAWGGRLVVRVAGHDGWPVRRQMARVLGALRGGPLPRVWQM
jgi:hypothetical protein